ncbi:MAG: hypothetical protein U1E86_27790 [Burkholderiaceae bacterium]
MPNRLGLPITPPPDPAVAGRFTAPAHGVSIGSAADLDKLPRRDIERRRHVIAPSGARPEVQRGGITP